MLETSQDNKIKSFLLIGIFLLVVFVLAVAVWYAPVLFKGYAATTMSDAILVSRNLAEYGVNGSESELNIVLAPSQVSEKGTPYVDGNKMTTWSYAQLFKIFGVPSHDNLVLMAIIINACTLIVLLILVYYLFGFKIAAIFSIIYILLPTNWWFINYNLAVYEFCLFFFSFFLLFYFIGLKSEKKYKYIFTILAGIFLALAGIGRETGFLITPFLFVYLWFSPKRKYYFWYFFIPFFIIVSLLWLPGIISGQNSYLQYFTTKTIEKPKVLNYAYYLYLFPDPYTYHFEREDFVNDYQGQMLSNDVSFLEKMSMIKVATNMGVERPSVFSRIKSGSTLFIKHVSRFFSLQDIGGPLIFLLFFFGLVYLRRENSYLYRFFIFWISSVILILSFVILAGRNHLMDFGWALALGISLGLSFLVDILVNYFGLKKTGKKILLFLFLILVSYQLLLSAHVLWGMLYNNDLYLRTLTYANKVNNSLVADNEVIITGFRQDQLPKLNFLTNKSFVIFSPKTLEKLIKQDKLSFAFEKFEVKYMLGYSDQLTEQVLDHSQIINLGTDSIEVDIPKTSKTKSWLMNLIR